MELRTYPINTDQLYAVNIKLHVSELLALHFDTKDLFALDLITKIKEATASEALKIKERKMDV